MSLWLLDKQKERLSSYWCPIGSHRISLFVVMGANTSFLVLFWFKEIVGICQSHSLVVSPLAKEDASGFDPPDASEGPGQEDRKAHAVLSSARVKP